MADVYAQFAELIAFSDESLMQAWEDPTCPIPSEKLRGEILRRMSNHAGKTNPEFNAYKPVTLEAFKAKVEDREALNADADLLDQFAMAALTGLIANDLPDDYIRGDGHEAITQTAYKIAHQMMKSRKEAHAHAG